MDDPTNITFQLLNNILREKIEQNEKETNTWTNYKNIHKEVIKGLQEFPLSVSENCMVPIGKLAFMKGKLIHTNEVLVCLGDSYFAKYSASQAIALCNRRISVANDTLKRLEAERNLYEMRQILPVEQLFGKQDGKDILEHWDEDKLDEWRIQHRKCEKEYHQKLAELREKEKTDISTEEDLFKRLDELELKEELEDEMCRLETEQQRFYGDDLREGEVYSDSEDNDDTSDSDSDKITIEMLQEELKRLKDISRNQITNDMSNVSNSCGAVQDETFNTNFTKNEQSDHTVSSIGEELKENCSTESEDIPKNTNIKRKKRISFMEPCDQNNADEQISVDNEPSMFEMTHSVEQDNTNDDIRIEFLPSSYIPNIPESDNTEIRSPADIYKIFSKPIKPILKRSPNDMFSQQVVPPSHEDSSSDTENECYRIKASAYTSIMKDICEKKAVSSLNNSVEKQNSERTVSRFKMERVRNTK